MFRLGTHNVNGIRASLRRGFTQFWDGAGADAIGLQEVRCRVADLPDGAFGGYHVALEVGELAGRNGVAVLTKQAPTRIRTPSGTVLAAAPGQPLEEMTTQRIPNRDLAPFAAEGRYVEVDLADVPVRVASVYVPKGAAPVKGSAIDPDLPAQWEEGMQAKYERKMRFLRGFSRLLTQSRRDAAAEGREFVVVGDFNVAHTRQDLKNWRSNQRSEGFLPEEREWFDGVVGPRRLLDVQRHLHPDAQGPYSWWSWRGQAWTNDAGWRIDYHLASPTLARSATSAWTAREEHYDSRMSDHSPVLVDYAFPIPASPEAH